MGSGLISPGHIAIVLIVVLLVFGPKRLPELGRSLGHGMRGFKEAITGDDDDDERPAPPPAVEGQITPAAEKAPAPAATAPAAPAPAAPTPAAPGPVPPAGEAHAAPPSGQPG